MTRILGGFLVAGRRGTVALLTTMALSTVIPGCSKPQTASKPPPAVSTPLKAVAGPILAKETLNRDDLANAALAKLAYQPADQFAPEFDASGLKGKKFEVEFTPEDGAGFPLSYAYDASSQMLTVTFDEEGRRILDGSNAWVTTMVIHDATVPVGAYAAQNAYGVKAEVTASLNQKVSLQTEDSPAHDPPSKQEWHFKLPPDVAREAAKATKVRLSGTISPAPKGWIVYCDKNESQPTVASPEETMRQYCLVSVRINKIELVGQPTGQ